jgi:glycosyltransferase involved in cell wall biosynthesis
MPLIYKHDYHPLSIYGNVISLLREYVPGGGGVHLDIGCGYGVIAEPVRDELDLNYIGLDIADDGLASLRGRGFQTCALDLADPHRCECIIAQVIDNQTVASISLLDTLEHITNGEEVLIALHRLAAEWNAPLVLSVPNVAHKDLALKLLLGRWDVTESGLLDHTHVTLYNYSRLSRLMKSVGWHKTATRDWPLHHSDQYFPKTSPLLNEDTPIGRMLLRLIDRANPHATVNQFVGLYRPGRPRPRPLLEDRVEPNAPFLSVIMTVTDPPASNLRGLLHQLADQTSHDFELVILHSADDPEKQIQTALLEGLPVLRGRTRLVAGSGLGSVAAHNAAVERCSGRYFAILDDAGKIDRDWIRALAVLADQSPGAVLQVDHRSSGDGHQAVNGNAQISPPLPWIGRLVDIHYGCFATLAIPTSVLRDLGLRFELELSDRAGWDLAIDAVLHCGVNYCSDSLVSALDGRGVAEFNAIGLAKTNPLLDRLDSNPILLPSGSAERIEQLTRDHAEAVGRLERERAETIDKLTRDHAEALGRLERERAETIDKLTRDHAEALGRLERDVSAHRARARKLETLISDRPLLRSLITTFCPAWLNDTQAVSEAGPFLSVITRTQGTRLYTLRDTFMSLAGQSCEDFEVVLVINSVSQAVIRNVRAIVDEFPPNFRARINTVTSERAGRSAALNDGIAHARGRYVAILDDDDIAMGHWVETFRQLAAAAPPGALLRTTCARQDFDLSNTGNVPPVPRAASWFKMEWPAIYDPVAHLFTNYTPMMCVAYPIAVFRNDGLQFDETLSTAEDWDFMLRAGMLRGMATSPEVTAIYRLGATADASTRIHTSDEWAANRDAVHHKLSAAPIALPAGSVSQIVSLFQDSEARAQDQQNDQLRSQIGEFSRRNDHLANQVVTAGGSIPWIDDDPRLAEVTRQILVDLVSARSWRVTRPLRQLKRVLTWKHEDDLTIDTLPSSASERLRLIGNVRHSTSWRAAAPFRAAGRLIHRR